MEERRQLKRDGINLKDTHGHSYQQDRTSAGFQRSAFAEVHQRNYLNRQPQANDIGYYDKDFHDEYEYGNFDNHGDHPDSRDTFAIITEGAHFLSAKQTYHAIMGMLAPLHKKTLPELINQLDATNRTALHHASRHATSSSAKILNLLINCNASLNIQDSLGNTPLIYSCIADNCESIKLLLGARADVHIRNNDGLSALEVCAKVKKSVPAVELFALNDITLNRGIPPVHWRTFFNCLGDVTKNFYADIEREGSSLFPLGFSATQPL